MIPWLCCYAIATVVSVAALFLKGKMFRDQIRRRRTEFVLDDEEQSDRIVKLKNHTKRSKHPVCSLCVTNVEFAQSSGQFFAECMDMHAISTS